eukprot:TRINITY_DN936_c0_g1_i10.p1 TRINITY_DN936_c0_g1~~TRINITY_DN936_c0_g1_i10.p1  ORF type:complete len:433 (+),score=107.35 TRINITY_DN936_c0_g1_i10:748-2046(+)
MSIPGQNCSLCLSKFLINLLLVGNPCSYLFLLYSIMDFSAADTQSELKFLDKGYQNFPRKLPVFLTKLVNILRDLYSDVAGLREIRNFTVQDIDFELDIAMLKDLEENYKNAPYPSFPAPATDCLERLMKDLEIIFSSVSELRVDVRLSKSTGIDNPQRYFSRVDKEPRRFANSVVDFLSKFIEQMDKSRNEIKEIKKKLGITVLPSKVSIYGTSKYENGEFRELTQSERDRIEEERLAKARAEREGLNKDDRKELSQAQRDALEEARLAKAKAEREAMLKASEANKKEMSQAQRDALEEERLRKAREEREALLFKKAAEKKEMTQGERDQLEEARLRRAREEREAEFARKFEADKREMSQGERDQLEEARLRRAREEREAMLFKMAADKKEMTQGERDQLEEARLRRAREEREAMLFKMAADKKEMTQGRC